MILNTQCNCRIKERSCDEQKRLINRLSRIEGQIRGLKTMVETQSYCIDIIIQASAVSAALSSFSKELLAEHIKTCVVQDIKEGNNEKVDELIDTLLSKIVK
ncbi:MAG: metal-sensing transcriptional repressor [Clostridia bacterium]|nr:metal-sensing transcriptional repressor [Clostridia bacterium]